MTKPWTPEEDERLRALIGKGAATTRIAMALKRSKSGVYRRARKLGLLLANQSRLDEATDDSRVS